MMHHFLRHALGFAGNVAQLVAWLALLVAIFVPLERLCALHPAKIWRKQIGVDLAWYFINSLLPAVILSVPLAILSRALVAMNPLGYYSMVAVWPLWVKLLLTLLVNDIGAYWGHRALHASPRLWRFHAIHHSAEELDWLVNTRAHPFDMVFTRLSGLAPVYLLGFAQSAGAHKEPVVLIATIFGTVWTFFLHANIRARLGPLEWLISSPAFHHWHHTKDEHRDRNFAFVFPFIDRLFGTAWLPNYWPPSYGIDEKVASTLTGQFFDPLEPALPQSRPETPSTAPTKPASTTGDV
jgi:sterol desaturase/sphingolipid hydroxylase (fatty acid hydroxylase superfamily)